MLYAEEAIPSPVHLAVSGRIAPHRASRLGPVHELEDYELIERLRRAGGLPSHVESEPDLLALMLTTIRGDFRIVDEYRHHPEDPLDCAMSAHCGTRDIFASSEEVAGWERYTTGPFSQHEHDGDHFFLTSHRSVIQDVLYRATAAALDRETVD